MRLFPWSASVTTKLRSDRTKGNVMQPCFPAVLLAAAMLIPISAAAKDKPSSALPTPAKTQTYTSEESARIGDEVQRRAEARQREWDRKTKALSRSICNGC